MSSLDDIPSQEVFEAALANQREAMFDGFDHALVGSDELSALVKAVISGFLFDKIEKMVGPGLGSWLVMKSWHPTEQVVHTIHSKLYPLYTTSMDAQVPGENIVMLAKQHRPPGVDGERWSALQEGEKVAYLANDRVLACRLNALRAMFRGK